MSYAYPAVYGVGASGKRSGSYELSMPSAYGSTSHGSTKFTKKDENVTPIRSKTPKSMEFGGDNGGYKEPIGRILDEFTETSIRHAFIRKVFSLLSICLLIAFGMCLGARLITPVREWLLVNGWVPLVAAIIMLILSLVIICVPKASEKVPINYILLFSYATAAGFVLAGIGAYYDLEILLLAVGTTVVVSVVLILFACQVKYDFTKWYPYVLVGLVVLILMGIIGIFVRVEWYQIVIGVIGTLIFSFLLVLDTQMIVGGKRKMQFSVDQYILATLTMFADIMNMFLYILRLFSFIDG